MAARTTAAFTDQSAQVRAALAGVGSSAAEEEDWAAPMQQPRTLSRSVGGQPLSILEEEGGTGNSFWTRATARLRSYFSQAGQMAGDAQASASTAFSRLQELPTTATAAATADAGVAAELGARDVAWLRAAPGAALVRTATFTPRAADPIVDTGSRLLTGSRFLDVGTSLAEGGLVAGGLTGLTLAEGAIRDQNVRRGLQGATNATVAADMTLPSEAGGFIGRGVTAAGGALRGLVAPPPGAGPAAAAAELGPAAGNGPGAISPAAGSADTAPADGPAAVAADAVEPGQGPVLQEAPAAAAAEEVAPVAAVAAEAPPEAAIAAATTAAAAGAGDAAAAAGLGVATVVGETVSDVVAVAATADIPVVGEVLSALFGLGLLGGSIAESAQNETVNARYANIPLPSWQSGV